jgi:hypothetical protein
MCQDQLVARQLGNVMGSSCAQVTESAIFCIRSARVNLYIVPFVLYFPTVG